ncbi:hypothetical protein PV08_01152 [Exophiala spinifera]|uniref:DUF7580 domain-containing protein n=1 Tax=Exophiala spinifera TaxID=91928 RepID=A0A0D2A742_9EURO|nr:uncharacterized protein PV08_01152 [Exophiala spinifera]KIW20577.1 hypothetical protein PV08_01152 [Exophiala spinifera]
MKEMLDHIEHSDWGSLAIAQALEGVLGSFIEPFVDTVREISQKLLEIETKLLSRPTFWLALTMPQYEKSMKELRELNGDLLRIQSSVCSTTKRPSSRRYVADSGLRLTPEEVRVSPPGRHEEALRVSNWAQKVYAGLRIDFTLRCQEHRQHRCLFHLVPRTHLETNAFRFHVAIRHPIATVEKSNITSDAWLCIETQAKPLTVCRNTQDVGLCRQLSTLSPVCKIRSPMGVVDTDLTACFVPRDQMVSTSTSAMKSVGTVFREKCARSSESCHAAFNMFERFRLAHHVATAVLFFHTTPWLQRGWNIDQIYLMDGAICRGKSLNRTFEPCLDVAVTPSDANSLRRLGTERLIGSSDSLFRLGIFLLEIAFERPLQDLPEPRHSAFRMSQWKKELQIALYNQPLTSRIMGPAYSKIVKVCLESHPLGERKMTVVGSQPEKELYSNIVAELGALKNMSKGIWT